MSLSSAQQILKMFEQSLSKGRNLTHRFKNLGLMKLTLRRLNLSPLQILAVGYFLIVLVISLLLMMPVSNAQGQSQSFIDALFMASSGISTTGLTVVNIGEYYSLFGQVTLLIDFQIGGIGYMALFIFLGYLLQIDFSLKSRLVAAESLSGARIGRSYSFFSKVIFFTLVFELAGGLILGTYWMRDFSWTNAFYLGIFHSISAFCTAGFCLFPESLVPYSHSFVVNAVIIILSLAGGIGFCPQRNHFRSQNENELAKKSKVIDSHSARYSCHDDPYHDFLDHHFFLRAVVSIIEFYQESYVFIVPSRLCFYNRWLQYVKYQYDGHALSLHYYSVDVNRGISGKHGRGN